MALPVGARRVLVVLNPRSLDTGPGDTWRRDSRDTLELHGTLTSRCPSRIGLETVSPAPTVTSMDQKQDALRLLARLENGGASPADAVALARNLDPVLIYTIVSFLRAVYPASNPAATSVLQRVVGLISNPAVARLHQAGKQDPVTQWLESEHEYRDFYGRGPELVGLVVDKLES